MDYEKCYLAGEYDGEDCGRCPHKDECSGCEDDE